MKSYISNEIVIEEPTQELLDWAKNNLVLDNPEYKQMKLLGKENIIKWKHIPEQLNLYAMKRGRLVLPFGVLRCIWDKLKQGEIVTDFNSLEPISIANDEPTYPLYDYQEPAVKEIVFRKGGVLVASCGSGKTTMGIEIIKRIGKKALWLCHTSDLLRQAQKDFLTLYPNAKIGLTTNGKLEIGEDVTISTVQTMSQINPDLYKDEFEVVVCDESAHVCSAPTQMKMFGTVLSNIKARYKIGLTATPARSDGMIKAMYAYIGVDSNGNFGPMYKIDRSQVKTMPSQHIEFDLNNGYENRLDEFCDTSGMIVYNNLISALSEDYGRTETVVENIVKCAKEGRKQVALTLRVEHCEQIVEMLNKRGIKAVLCVGSVTAKQRSKILNQEIEWDVLVATYALLKEGVSIKELDTLHLITPVKDKGTVVQCAGRIERYLEGKKTPIVFDYVDIDIPYCVRAYNQRRRALKTRF